ncbi:hypothetical protein OG21DRAFT_140933 [Imleria badia]|nr:hypothetical protein OG21DRAFT_140933 [Imleria badia]
MCNTALLHFLDQLPASDQGIVIPKGMRMVASIAADNLSLCMYRIIAYQISHSSMMDHTSSTLTNDWRVWQAPLATIQTCVLFGGPLQYLLLTLKNGNITLIGGVRACLGWRFAYASFLTINERY